MKPGYRCDQGACNGVGAQQQQTQLKAIGESHLLVTGEPPHISQLPRGLTVIIGVVRESQPGETRVAVTPTTVGELRRLGYEVVVEPGAGDRADFPDEGFVDAGASVGEVYSVNGGNYM